MSRPSRRKHRPRVLIALTYNDPQLHYGIASFAHQAGWIVDFTMARYGKTPDDWRGDGILTLLMPDRPEMVEWLGRQRVPIVSLNADAHKKWPGVMLDHEATGCMVAQHFIDRGLEHLAFFRRSDVSDVVGRQAGFVETAEAAGCECRIIDWRSSSDARPKRFDSLVRAIRRLPRPSGILVQSDHRAAPVFAACEEAGCRVPSDAAVIGVDNDEMVCEFAPVPLSSVDTNRRRLAWEGAALLDRILQGEKNVENPPPIPPVGIVGRESSDLLAVRHEGVAQALRQIWSRYAEPINANDVLLAIPISRGGLYRAFHKYVGRSIGDELLRVRVECAKRLLLDTRDKMSIIAMKSGFTSGEHFARSFSRWTGESPSAFRREHAVADPFEE